MNPDSFAAGNMTESGKTHIGYQQLAAKSRKEADSVEDISRGVSQLHGELKKLDEEQAIKQGATFRNNFGCIQGPIVTNDEISIVMLDQPMAMLYHEHIRNNSLFIDGSGTAINNIKGFKKILYYAAVTQHPHRDSPPLPVAEYITTKQDQYLIRQFLGTIHEQECIKYNNGNVRNPKLIMHDYSMAIIQACLNEFCNENMRDYSDRTYKTVSGKANGPKLEKTFLHVCAFYMMRINRKQMQ